MGAMQTLRQVTEALEAEPRESPEASEGLGRRFRVYYCGFKFKCGDALLLQPMK